VVVQASAKKLQETFGPDVTSNHRYREALVEMSVVFNAALSAYTLQQEMGNRGIGVLKAVFGAIFLRPVRSGHPFVARRSGPGWRLGGSHDAADARSPVRDNPGATVAEEPT